MFVFFSTEMTVMSLCLSVEVLNISLNRLLLSFAHFAKRHNFMKFSMILTICMRNFMRLTLLMIFFFLLQTFMYVCQSFKSRLYEYARRNCLVSFTAYSYSTHQKDLTCTFDFVHETATSIIFWRWLYIKFIWLSIFSIMLDCESSILHSDSMLFIFFIFISFQALLFFIVNISLMRSSFVEIEIWSDDLLKFSLDIQCSSRLIMCSDIKIKFMMLEKFLTSHVIVSLNNVSIKSFLLIKSISWFVYAC